MNIWRFVQQTGSITDKLETVRKLYDVSNIQNRIKDGTVPYPEDAQKLKHGITIEFRLVSSIPLCTTLKLILERDRNVSFKYPGSDAYALHDVSFKLLAGQLCVRMSYSCTRLLISSTLTGDCRLQWLWQKHYSQTHRPPL